MYLRRALSTAIINRAGHFCLRATCKQCMAYLAINAVRTLATKPARQEPKEFELSRLTKPLEQEITFQQRLIRDEKLSVERVLQDYTRMIEDNNIAIEKDEDSGEVKMILPREGYKYIVRFDPSEVAQAVNSTPMNEEDAEEENDEEATDDLEEFDEEDMEGELPFNVNIEICRDGVEKSLELGAEVYPSSDGRSYDLHMMDLQVENSKYAGPSYDTLDEDLREQFDQLLSKNFRKMMPFVADYSRAMEATMYKEWLDDVKTIVATH